MRRYTTSMGSSLLETRSAKGCLVQLESVERPGSGGATPETRYYVRVVGGNLSGLTRWMDDYHKAQRELDNLVVECNMWRSIYRFMYAGLGLCGLMVLTGLGVMGPQREPQLVVYGLGTMLTLGAMLKIRKVVRR